MTALGHKDWIDRPAGRPLPRPERPDTAFALANGAAITVPIALLVTALPVFGHILSQGVAIATCVIGAVLVRRLSPAAIPVAILTSFIFQNMFVAMVLTTNTDKATLDLLRSYNFLALATQFLLAFTWLAVHYRNLPATVQQIVRASVLALTVVGFYFVLGLAKGPSSAIAYLRNVAGANLCFLVGLSVALAAPRGALRGFSSAVTVLAVLAIAYGYAELAFDFSFLELFGGDVYLGLRFQDMTKAGAWVKVMRETGHVLRDHLDMFRTTPLNLALLGEWGVRFYRPSGPNFHSISFAYGLSFLMLWCIARGRGTILALLTVPLLVVVGSKGAILVFVLAWFGLSLSRSGYARQAMVIVASLLPIYLVVAFIVGMRSGDFHVLGFFGGVSGFLSNPIGHGLGSQGNIGSDMSQIDWSAAQHIGRTSLAVESAVGVMLYQLGIGAFVVVGFYLWLCLQLWRLYGQTRQPLLALSSFCLLALATNGVLQEEALFSPLALAIVMLGAGLAVGNELPVDQRPRSHPRTSPVVRRGHAARIGH